MLFKFRFIIVWFVCLVIWNRFSCTHNRNCSYRSDRFLFCFDLIWFVCLRLKRTHVVHHLFEIGNWSYRANWMSLINSTKILFSFIFPLPFQWQWACFFFFFVCERAEYAVCVPFFSQPISWQILSEFTFKFDNWFVCLINE